MNIIVTGINGSLSKIIANRLREEHSVDQISVRGALDDSCIPEHTDCVVHIAGVTPANAKSADEYELVNANKTGVLYEICQRKKVKHFIYISSMSVYEGYFQKFFHRAIDKNTPCEPVSLYARSKRAAEELLINKCNNETFYTILRVPSLYDDEKIEYFETLSRWARRMPIVPISPFNTKRSLLHTRNLCAIIMKLVNQQVNENSIVLPQDYKIPDVSMLTKKVMRDQRINKRITYIGGAIMHCASLLLPQYRGIFRSIYYAPEDSMLIDEASIDDLML